MAMTLVACAPAFCGCNRTWAGVRIWGERRGPLGVLVECNGDDCSRTCTPFAPYAAERMQLSGVLVRMQARDTGLFLQDIDVSASRQWVDGEWQPIPEGSFVLPLRTEGS